MAKPYIEVLSPDLPPQIVELASERVVVGSAITCNVVVDRPEFAREHLLLSPRADGCYVAVARGVPTPVYYNGVAFERGIVPWGSELVVGVVRFMLHDGTVSRPLAVAASAPQTSLLAQEAKINPAILVLAAVVLPLAAWMLFNDPAEDVPRANVPAPQLFDPLEQRACPQRDPVQARVLAVEAARQAVAKAERMPFRAQDGIEAVNQHALAAACYRLVEQAREADAQLASGRALASRIDDEYHNHRFRLDRALEQNRTEDALVEARLLKNLVAHRQGPYLSYLVSLERRLQLLIDQAAAGTR